MTIPVARPAIMLLCLVCAATVLTGCESGSPTLEDLIGQAATLPGVRASKHSKLREEFRLVEASGTLPHQLNRDAKLVHQNAAVALAQALADLDLVTTINEQAGGLLSAVPAAEPALIQSECSALGAKWLHQTNAVVEASRLPDCDFQLHYERGYFNDLDFIYRAAAACRLLLLDTLHHLDDRSVAFARFDAAWQWADWLAATGHLEARVQAALVRREALYVAETIANTPGTTPQDLANLYATLQRSLENWPTLEATLVRERALAIATYETIRLGLAELLFTIEERAELRAAGVYQSLRNPTDEQVDADQAAYLAYMREVISVADQPFHERSKHLVECDRLLRAGEQVDDYPWFANHLFVLESSMTMAQAELARDRARVEGWLHLLAAATGKQPPANQVNPLNGEPYAIESRGSQRYVALGDRRSVNPRLSAPGP